MRPKKILILPVVKLIGKQKRWTVIYSVRNPKSGAMERFRINSGFDACNTIAEKKKHGDRLCKEYSAKLLAGWTPFDGNQVVYEDQIVSSFAARIYGRKRSGNKTPRYFLSDFLLTKKHLQDKTYETYNSKITIFCNWLEKQGLGENDITTIDTVVLDKFWAFIIDEQKLSKLTVEKYWQIIRSFFNYLIDKKVLRISPVGARPKVKRVCDNSAKPINPKDLEAFKNAIRPNDPQLWLAMQFEFYCYIRPGRELRNMKFYWLNLAQGIITIPAEFAKNGKKENVVIPSHFLKTLKEEFMLQLYDAELYVFSKNAKPGRDPLGKNTLRNRFNRFRDDLGLSKQYKFYSSKHTGAMMASNNNIPIKDIQMQMRHSSLEITDKYLKRMTVLDSDALKNNYPHM